MEKEFTPYGLLTGFTPLNNRRANLTGFTLIELMIVAALIIMFAGLTMPVGFNFYQESTLKDEARKLESSLRMAQAMAMTGRGESNAGIEIEEKQYTIFEGESFGEHREEVDTIIPFSIVLSISEKNGIWTDYPYEIVFQKSTGLPILPEEKTPPIILNLTFGANSQVITINSQGRIEMYEPSE